MTAFTALNGGDTKSAPEAPLPAIRASSEDQMARSVEPVAAVESSSNKAEPWRSAEKTSFFRSTSYAETEGSHKRKRSNSPEPRRESSGAREPQPPPPPPPQQSQQQHSTRSSEPRESYSTPQRERDYRPFATESQDRDARYGQSREDRYDSQASAPSRPSPVDEHSNDVHRKLGGSLDTESQYDDYNEGSPDGDDGSVIYPGSYTPEQRRDGVIHSDPKKRKRNFSNRTKTGCLTCRKRKKKCDEAKPECQNCVRGGFTCQGYPNSRGYQKMETKASAVPLESKDPSYIPPGAYGMPQQPTSYSSAPSTAPKRDALPPYRGQPLRIDPPQGRPVMSDDDRLTASTLPSASVGSPDNKLSALSSYTHAANVFPTPISAVTQLQTPLSGVERKSEYQRVPPLHDLTRNEPETPHPGTLPQISVLHATRTSSPLSQPPAPTTNPQVAAQLALSHTSFPGNRSRTQKEEMLSGSPYFPFDNELVKERQRCSAACWRFNNSTNPNTGVSSSERSRLFQQILSPTEPINLSPHNISPVTNKGRVGSEVVVEAPFTCDYGYNITIGNNVFIGRNCTILDPREIKIGSNSFLGPNVSLLGAHLHTDPKRRMGSKSPHLGKPIIIEEDVWIGASAIILPGFKIGKGATVAAGSVVTSDVPPFTVVSGNPARVRRGA